MWWEPGQTLHVVSGVALVGTREHLALRGSDGSGGRETTRLAKVTEAQCDGPRTCGGES